MSEIKKIKLEDIVAFKNHPFKVEDNESFKELVQSIKENGLLNPIIVRPKDNKYEIISGHRRLKAMELNGYDEIETYIKELNDDEAIIQMVDSNLQRDKILPSEKAFSFKMKLDAIKHQGKTCGHDGHKSREKISDESGRQIQRYIRLTYLIPELLNIVDRTYEKNDKHSITMGLLPAVELSYLNKDEQMLVYSEMTYEDLSPSHAQAIRIRKLSEKKQLNAETLEDILTEQKGNQHEQISFNKENIEKALPYELTKRDKRYIERYIIKAIQTYRSIEREGGDLDDIDL